MAPWKSCWLSGFKIMAENFWGFYVEHFAGRKKRGDSTNMVHLLPVVTRCFSWRYSIYQEYVLLYLKVFMEITPDTLDWMSRTTWKKPGLCEASGEKLPNQFLFPLGVERKKTHQLLTFTKSGYFAKILAPEPKKSWWGGAQPRTGYPDTPVAPTTGAKPSWKTQQSDAVSSSLPPFPSSVAPLKSQVTSSDPTKTGYKRNYIPSKGLTYPTWGKGKSSSKCHFWWIC